MSVPTVAAPAEAPGPPGEAGPLRGAAAFRFVLTCALAGPPLGYGILALLLAAVTLPFDPDSAFLVLASALFGIVYFGVGIVLAYLAGLGPSAAAGLLCLWWFNRHGSLGRTPAAVAGFSAGLASVAIILWATESWRSIGAPTIPGLTFFASIVATSILCSLIIAPRALRRALR